MRTGAGTVVAFGVVSLLTAAIAWPVLVSPAERIFGAEIVGRHHDPFTVMWQMAGSGATGLYLQPVTDWAGWLLARVLHPVSAYNVVILASFPLTAAATYALARYLLVPHGAALIAAIFFTLAPIRLAHAAYHPHIVQTQWLPLYLLALFATIDRPSRWRGVGLAVSCAGLVLSNFYAGLIGAVLTPVAIVAYWATSPRKPRPRHVGIAAASVAGLGAAGIIAIALLYPQLLSSPSAYGFPSTDVADYSARWWAYLVPPVTHAALGGVSASMFQREGVTLALLEQQVFISYALVALAVVAAIAALTAWRRSPAGRPIVGLWAIAVAAFVISVGPLGGDCADSRWEPACQIHNLVPMFRAYARFALVVHLAMAIAAGAGVVLLARRGRAGRIVAVSLVAIAAFEYWPLPAQTRDVLPTEGHRWLAAHDTVGHALDCTAPAIADAHLAWLTERRLSFLGQDVSTCRDPWLGPKLAALGYTHVIVRRPDSADALPLLDKARSGLTPAADFPLARVYAVATPRPDIVVMGDQGFFEYEYAGDDEWRWMGPVGRWQIRNTADGARHAVLDVVLESVHEARDVEVLLDGRSAGVLHVPTRAEAYTLGPWPLEPGLHTLVFRAVGEPFQPSAHGVSADNRVLTVAFRAVSWTVR